MARRTKRKDKIRVYQDQAGEWRWTRIAANGNYVADSAEGYDEKRKAYDAAVRESDPPEAVIEIADPQDG